MQKKCRVAGADVLMSAEVPKCRCRCSRWCRAAELQSCRAAKLQKCRRRCRVQVERCSSAEMQLCTRGVGAAVQQQCRGAGVEVQRCMCNHD